jgi:hypothetical protein
MRFQDGTGSLRVGLVEISLKEIGVHRGVREPVRQQDFASNKLSQSGPLSDHWQHG